MLWKDFSREFRDGDHAFLSPSSHSWINYSDEKLAQVFVSKKLAADRGSAFHELARRLILLKIPLPDTKETLNMYVNDAIAMGLRPEEKLYYSKFCYGTADAISYDHNVLHIHDLKTGKLKVTFVQLEIYAALFFLAYDDYVALSRCDGIELRIYQNNEVLIENRGPEDILPIMDRIQSCSKILEMLEANFDEGFEALGRRT